MHTSIDSPAGDLGRAAREIVTRSVAAVGLAGIALIHLLDSLGKFQETPYMGWMYVGLMLSCLALAATLLHTHAREAWLATIALPASAIVGFILTRTTGLPQAHAARPSRSRVAGRRALTFAEPLPRSRDPAAMPHLSELHGAATHLAVVAVPVYLLILLVRRSGRGGTSLAAAEPWVVGAAIVGVALAGLTGLLVWGQSKTELRGSSGHLGTIHFWLGIALAVIVVAVAAWRFQRAGADRHTHGLELVAGGLLAVAAVLAQGYIGGRMTYEHGVGVDSGGQLAQTAAGTAQLEVALAQGTPAPVAGKQAFSTDGLGCASCHGDQAQGLRGPRLAGGVELQEFRGVHAHGLFPPSVVTNKDFAAINAWLQSLPGPTRRRDQR